MAHHTDDTATTDRPCTPPPTLASTCPTATSSASFMPYTRAGLLAIARGSRGIVPPAPDELARVPEILRNGSLTRWCADEHTSVLDDTEPIARTLLGQTPPDLIRLAGGSVSDGESDTGSVLKYSLEPKLAVLVDFADPFDTNPNNKASAAFQAFPPVSRSRTTSISSDSSSRAIHLGERYTSLRQASRSSSISSSFSSSPIMRKASLNPWAAPFPLPDTTPVIGMASNTLPPYRAQTDIPSLPLPKSLPASLPARPGPPPPVFVKKESATLPQPMALPEVKPMSEEWAAEENISGNEKRRRASEVGGGLVNMRMGSLTVTKPGMLPMPEISVSLGEKRPERLVRLGQSLRRVSLQRVRVRACDML